MIIPAVFLLLVFLLVPPTSARATSPPPGFYPLESQPGLELYRKDYPGGNPDFVLVVDLTRQTGVHLLHGPMGDPGNSLGAYGGASPRFARQSLDAYWKEFEARTSRAACVVNGGFFSTFEDPAPLAFGVKTGGSILSEGYARDEYPDQKLLLELWADKARIVPLNEAAFKNSDAPQTLAGLHEAADKDPNALTGRTFIGLADLDEDGFARSLLVFTSKTTRQADAAAVLRDFGAQQVMMLDGGESTQFLCDGQPYVYSERLIPQAIGISAGIIPDYEAVVERQSDWPVLVEGESLEIELIIKNNGSKTWQPGEVSLVNRRNDWGAGELLVVNTALAPGETAAFRWQTPVFERRGVFTSSWDVVRAGQSISTRPVVINVIVIPIELEAKKQELEAQVRDWARQKLENIEQLVLEWIQSQIRQSAERAVDWVESQVRSLTDKICPASTLLPGVVIALGAARARRREKE